MNTTDNGSGIYFTLKEIGLIIVLSVLAAVSGAVVPSILFPEGSVSGIVYSMLGLPGPGAGVLIFGSILCFWLLFGRALIRKPGTAVAMAVVMIAFDLLFGTQVILVQTLDVLVIVAVIIEAVCLFPVERTPGSVILPAILAVFGVVTIAIALLGLAKQGEMDGAAAGFPWAYYLFGLLGLCLAFTCYRYPARFCTAAGIANMYYMLHFWLFWGAGFATRFPPDLLMIPVLLLVAATGGIVSGAAAYGIGRLISRSTFRTTGTSGDQ